jgi:hypothetical protein
VAVYTGDILEAAPGCQLVVNDHSRYILQLSKQQAIDAARTNVGPGRWANDPRHSSYGSNARFSANHRLRTCCIVATRNIPAKTEILIPYGREYWQALNTIVAEVELHATSVVDNSLVDRIRLTAAADPEYQQLVAASVIGPGPSSSSSSSRLADGLLFIGDRLHVPNDEPLRTSILSECHDTPTAGHLGRDKTTELVKRRFYWSGMDADIEQYVLSCDSCQRNKPSHQCTAGPLMPLPIPQQPWEQVSLDLITQLPRSRSGNDAIVVFVDKLTKLVHYAPTASSATAPQLAELFLREVVRLHGVPKSILSDRDPRFTAHFWQSFWLRLGTTLTMSTAYHPQTDGQTERANRTLETLLRSVVNFEQDDWDDHLPLAELAINNAQQSSTGSTPFFLQHGREAQMPVDHALSSLRPIPDNPSAQQRIANLHAQLALARTAIARAQARQSDAANVHRRQDSFAVGDLVLLSTEHLKLLGPRRSTPKLAGKFVGPFAIRSVVNANAYELDLPPLFQIHPTINISRLKRYQSSPAARFPSRPDPFPRPPPVAVSDNDAPSFEVESILAEKGRGRNQRFLVKWVGYPLHESTWEQLESLDGAHEALADFQALGE